MTDRQSSFDFHTECANVSMMSDPDWFEQVNAMTACVNDCPDGHSFSFLVAQSLQCANHTIVSSSSSIALCVASSCRMHRCDMHWLKCAKPITPSSIRQSCNSCLVFSNAPIMEWLPCRFECAKPALVAGTRSFIVSNGHMRYPWSHHIKCADHALVASLLLCDNALFAPSNIQQRTHCRAQSADSECDSIEHANNAMLGHSKWTNATPVASSCQVREGITQCFIVLNEGRH